MKTRYQIVDWRNHETGEFLHYGIFIFEGKDMYGLAENGKPLEFKTRSEAKECAKKFIQDKQLKTA
jgi:hypothetical protein